MQRVPELDAIRGLAALAIMIHHLPDMSQHLVGRAFGYGVDLFFVFSGYLITTVILHNRNSRDFLLKFYARWSLRIWPLYYLALVVAANFALPHPYRLDALPYYFTYTQEVQHYWTDRLPAFTPWFEHTWTLALEEQYYIFWPALLCLVGRSGAVPLALGLIATSTVARGLEFNPRILLARCAGFGLGGVLAALLLNREAVDRHRRAYVERPILALKDHFGYARVELAVAAARDEVSP